MADWTGRIIAALLGAVIAAPAAVGVYAAADDEASEGTSKHSNATNYDEADIEEEAEEEEKAPELTAADWIVNVPIRSQECYGSAGCNIVFGVKPEYVGVEDISVGHFLVTFEVRGIEDGPYVDTIEIEDGSMEWSDEGSSQTTHSGAKIRAVVTSVETLDY